MEGRTDRHNVANIPFLQFVVRRKWNKKFIERFSKYPQKCPVKSFIAEMQLNGETGLMNVRAKFNNLEDYYKYVSKVGKFCEMAVYWRSEEPNPHYLRSGQNSYTRRPLADKVFHSEIPYFNYQHES